MTPSITCRTCWKTSYHPVDVAQGYCGNCHTYGNGVVVDLPMPPPRPILLSDTRVAVDGQPPELTQFINDVLADATADAVAVDPSYLDRMVALLRAKHLPDTWEHGQDAYRVSYEDTLAHIDEALR